MYLVPGERAGRQARTAVWWDSFVTLIGAQTAATESMWGGGMSYV